jgi:hypothetical protein
MIRWNQIVIFISHTVFFLTSLDVPVSLCKRCMAYTTHTKFQRLRRQPSLVHRTREPRMYSPIPTLSVSLKSNNNSNQEERLLQQLVEPFDRWRYLQKLLDEDINDASDILFIFRTFVHQQLQRQKQQQQQDSSRIFNPRISPKSLSPQTTPLKDAETADSDARAWTSTSASNTEALSALSITATPSLDYDDNYMKAKRHEIMEFIVNDLSSDTIRNLIQHPPPHTGTDENDILLLELLEQLLPDPDNDEDAAKGLWDTIIELHGRESVKINERQIPQNIGWRTRCLIARLLIYYDFLTDGLSSPTH